MFTTETATECNGVAGAFETFPHSSIHYYYLWEGSKGKGQTRQNTDGVHTRLSPSTRQIHQPTATTYIPHYNNIHIYIYIYMHVQMRHGMRAS